MNFLSAMLRDEGGLEYKASIADTVITIIEENPDAKETGMYWTLMVLLHFDTEALCVFTRKLKYLYFFGWF